jgi:hypothetical protein
MASKTAEFPEQTPQSFRNLHLVLWGSVPFTRGVPMDLAGRLHRDGRMVRVGPEARLRRISGVGIPDDFTAFRHS